MAVHNRVVLGNDLWYRRCKKWKQGGGLYPDKVGLLVGCMAAGKCFVHCYRNYISVDFYVSIARWESMESELSSSMRKVSNAQQHIYLRLLRNKVSLKQSTLRESGPNIRIWIVDFGLYSSCGGHLKPLIIYGWIIFKICPLKCSKCTVLVIHSMAHVFPP